jgi:hypothetical protein
MVVVNRALLEVWKTSALVIIGEKWYVRQRPRIDVERANPWQEVGQFMSVLRNIFTSCLLDESELLLSFGDFFSVLSPCESRRGRSCRS